MHNTAAPFDARPESLAGDNVIGTYVEAALAALTRALRAATVHLVEPRVTDPHRALRVLDKLAETLTGFAIGTIGGEVLRVVSIWFGDEVALSVRGALGDGWPGRVRHGQEPSTKYLDDADQRPLVDMLARRLYGTFCRAGYDVRSLLDTVRETVECRAPSRASWLAAMLGELARDETIERRLRDELAFGWQVYVAAITDKPFPSTTDRWARSRALWQAWQWQLVGRPVLTRSEHEAQGYILLVR